jgi:hypothetical protein
VVFDSATALAFRALQKAVADGDGASVKGGFRPTIEVPGLTAYGGRNARVLAVLTGLLRVTAKHGVHVIVTGHEAEPTTRPDGRGNDVIEYIGVQLGGQLVNNVTVRLSEIWHLRQKNTGDKGRVLSFRPSALRRPMKSRMFRYDTEPSFDLVYDAEKPDDAKGQMTIAGWYDEWIESGKKKMMPPKARVSHK